MQRTRLGAAVVAVAALLGTAGPARSVDLVVGADVTNENCAADVPLSISGGGGNTGGFKLDVQWDTASFTLPNPSDPCTLATGLPGQVFTQVDPADVPPQAGRSTLRVVLLDFGGGTYPDGVAVTCKFRPTAGTAGGLYVLDAVSPEASDPDGNALAATATDGEISVIQPTFCCPQ